MKSKFYLFVFSLLLIAQKPSAQSWSIQTSNTLYPLLDVNFVDQNLGFVCGYNGTILKTVNGGSVWTTLNTGVTESLAGIQFVNNKVGYASGGFIGGTEMNCKLIKTTDGGDHWSNIDVAPGKCGSGIWFLNADTGFCAYADGLYGGSSIARTTNGGGKWDVVYAGAAWISFFHFADNLNGYASVNNGTVVKTSDGGKSWSVTSLGQSMWGSGIFFFDKDTGFVGGKSNGNAAIFKTVDGGTSWQPIVSDNMIYQIYFADKKHGYALSVDISGAGKIIKSTDGGDTWIDDVTPVGNMRGIHFLNANLGFAVGNDGMIIKYGFAASINENQQEAGTNLSVFPNPFSRYTTIKINNQIVSDKISVKVYNASGAACNVIQHKQNSSIILEKGDLTAGIYFFKVFDADRAIGEGRFIIE